MSTRAEPPAPPAAGHRLDRYRSIIGTAPDAEIAALAGVSADEVKLYRRENNIAAFLRPPPGAVPRESVDDGRTVPLVRPAETRAPPPPSPPVEVPVPPSPTLATTTGGLEAQRHRLGRVADQVIADELGLSRGVVGAYRRKLGIEAYDGFRFTAGSRPTPTRPGDAGVPPVAATPTPAASTTTPAPAARASSAPLILKNQVACTATPAEPAPSSFRSSKLDPYRDIVGVLTDREVAERAGLTAEAVRMFRKRHGIPSRWSSPASEVAPTVSASAAAVVASPSVVVPPGESHDAPRVMPEAPVPVPAPEPVVTARPTVPPTQATPSAPLPAVPEAPTPAPPAPATATPAPIAADAAVAPTTARVGEMVEARAFVVLAGRGAERRRFVCVSAGITQALGTAVRALGARQDGPWHVLGIREGNEALVERGPFAVAPREAVSAPLATRPATSPPAPPPAPEPAPEVAAPTASPAANEPVGAAVVARVTGDDLARYRREHGLPQRVLGARLGVGQATVSKLESGRSQAVPDVIAARFAALVGAGA